MPRVVFDETNETENIDTGSLDGIRRPRRKSGKMRQTDQLPPVPAASGTKGRRDIAETYRESQKLSYDTVEYYEKMNKMLAGEAEKAMNENRDLNLRISELETKLVLVAGLIKEKEMKKMELQVCSRKLDYFKAPPRIRIE